MSTTDSYRSPRGRLKVKRTTVTWDHSGRQERQLGGPRKCHVLILGWGFGGTDSHVSLQFLYPNDYRVRHDQLKHRKCSSAASTLRLFIRIRGTQTDPEEFHQDPPVFCISSVNSTPVTTVESHSGPEWRSWGDGEEKTTGSSTEVTNLLSWGWGQECSEDVRSGSPVRGVRTSPGTLSGGVVGDSLPVSGILVPRPRSETRSQSFRVFLQVPTERET